MPEADTLLVVFIVDRWIFMVAKMFVFNVSESGFKTSIFTYRFENLIQLDQMM